MRSKVVSLTPEPDSLIRLMEKDTFTVACPEWPATYFTGTGRGKCTPQATSEKSITGLVEYHGRDAKGRVPWVYLSCLGPHDDPDNADTELQILYISNPEIEKCVGCTELLNKVEPG